VKIKFTDDLDCDTVTLTCDTWEYALLHASLNAFLQVARNPRSASDRAAEGDIDLANELELQMFKAYCNRGLPSVEQQNTEILKRIMDENPLPAKEQPKYVSHQPKGQPFSVSRFIAECDEQDRKRKETK
jgi:hypothetical protein